jgi:hypothetical protein
MIKGFQADEFLAKDNFVALNPGYQLEPPAPIRIRHVAGLFSAKAEGLNTKEDPGIHGGMGAHLAPG